RGDHRSSAADRLRSAVLAMDPTFFRLRRSVFVSKTPDEQCSPLRCRIMQHAQGVYRISLTNNDNLPSSREKVNDFFHRRRL
ncbi:MAG: hypothetical protein IJW45_05560, partial [Oscillospiraceae bacterium]|nr:hypothetical protein [Oscillospiraceae bacterium]